MGGKAVKNVRPLKQEEVRPTYEWVAKNMLPLLGLEKEDAIPIGSFGKKPLNETSGDIDIAIDANKFIMEDGSRATLGYICEAMDCIFGEMEGYETTLLKGFDQLSVKVPINGNESNGYAQVDFMPSTDLKWAEFMYHSPNLAEGESKYKGAVRNAFLMAILSESTKETTKLFEGKAEEYSSLAIRFPTGVWNIKRSFMGKKGKLVQKGTVLESEFLTKDPQDVIDLAFGPGYGIRAANSFETLWELAHRKDFIHKHRLNEIMSKFAVNLKSMQMDTPIEAIVKYPLVEGINDVLKPKSEEEILDAANRLLYKSPPPSLYDLYPLHNSGILKLLDKDKLKTLITSHLLEEANSNKNLWKIHNRIKKYAWTQEYVDPKIWEEVYNKTRYIEAVQAYASNVVDQLGLTNEYSGQTKQEIIQIEKDLKREHEKQHSFLPFIKIIKGDLPYKSLSRIIRERIKRNQFSFFYYSYLYTFKIHPTSHFPLEHIRDLSQLVDKKVDKVAVADLRQGTSGRKVDSLLDPLIRIGLFETFKQGNKQFIQANPGFKENEDFISRNYYKFVNELYDKADEYDVPELNEELLAHIGDPFDPIGLYKNPERIDKFDKWAKAFLDPEGNLFMEDIQGDWLHKDMAEKLRLLGKLNFRGNFYDNNFVTLIRIDDTKNFAYTEGTTDNMVARDIMAKAQKKFPQYKFFAKHYEDVKHER